MATKQKNIWSCTECGHSQSHWAGQCPLCKQWNTLHEEVAVSQPTKRYSSTRRPESKPMRLRDVPIGKTPRVQTGLQEFDRLVGGGIVPGSLSLVGGDPGIGKSTLMLQTAQVLAKQGLVVLYVCGEESLEQTSLRGKRLGVESDNLYLLNETSMTHIKAQVENLKPDVLVIDSIQIVYKDEVSSAPGSVSQVRECATELMHLAKGQRISTFLVGHVTKSGEIAGPRVLEHLVDTVLYFEGDKQHNYRLLRVVKNRFGSTDEIAVFQMRSDGLHEVGNPSEVFLNERSKELIGSAVIPTLEGSRTLLVEVQSLVTDTVFSTPSRRVSGLDMNRLALLLAVLEKRLGYQLHRCDVFVSVTGGIRIQEPAADLGIALAVASSLWNRVIDPHTLAVGEVGLGGELRSVPRMDTRIKEAIHMGFRRCVIPKRNEKALSAEFREQIEIVACEMIEEAIHAIVH